MSEGKIFWTNNLFVPATAGKTMYDKHVTEEDELEDHTAPDIQSLNDRDRNYKIVEEHGGRKTNKGKLIRRSFVKRIIL